MKTALAFLAILTTASPFASAAENRLGASDFAGGTAGSPPAKPWLATKETPGITVKLETLPAGMTGPGATDITKLWAHLVDGSTDQPAGIRQNFDPITAGRLQWKVCFLQLGSSFSILLGDPNVSKPETRVLELKMNSKGQVNVGDAANRTKTGFAFRVGQVYELYLDFKPSEEGKSMAVSVGTVGGDPIFTGTTNVVRAVGGLRFTSDGTGTGLDAFVTDVTLNADR